jgi:biotin carboxyl carrier protein
MYAALILAVLFVLMPFLFWRSTWFGRPLTDEEIQKNLADFTHPRKTQHALSQIADRVIARDPTVRRFYPQVVKLSSHQVAEIRITAAWVMGQDNSVAAFHQGLLRLLEDPHPLVQRNSALSLVRFGDPAGRPQIVAMLRPFTVRAPQRGTLAQRLKVGDVVNPGTLLARINAGRQEIELRSQIPGSVERWLESNGAGLSAGDAVVLLTPSPEMVWEALRALYLVGRAEDLPEVEHYARGVPGMPSRVQQQAIQALGAIRTRTRS